MANNTKGENRPNSVLDENKVREIRRLHSEQGLGKKKLSALFGVSPSVVYRIIKRESWGHVQ